ncbi:uncharacterized protein K452DRAFT_312637 [Aplosporella prunicola CBS 121167]|uniref:Uncharacterized protein n=1 Tax=Aplosporella prunicola CBS 121167 TaxID=1176127 RepID=A0A6A6B1H1_9PEZI|nr:uncharacterized protein K452DRAFT_312637 [Aplosporella prunicola CBS 121167]KAF2137074.1 hypothetical protein K452DRAFT_312637 [Aplosporella prunicola CBS 121167]
MLRDLENFDNASRGVKGCLWFLSTARYGHIASLGAVVTILALGFDTFAQNILGTQYHEVPQQNLRSVGLIPRSEIYNASNKIQNWFKEGLNFDMKAAISSSALGLKASAPSPACSTGNCSWPLVPSLAMCGSCADVTAKLKSNCTSGYCQYYLPDGMVLQGPKAGVSEAKIQTFATTLFKVGQTTSGQVYSDVLNKPGRIYAARFSAITTWVQERNPGDSLAATECALWFCIQAYNTSILSGIHHESVEMEYDMATFLDPQNLLRSGPGGPNFTGIPDKFNISEGTVFGPSYKVIEALNDSISEQVSGNVTWSGHYGAFQYSSDRPKAFGMRAKI